MDGNQKVKKRKTGVRRNTVCPVFNEAFTFNIDRATLKKCRMVFTVMHDSLLSTNEFLGKCEVGKGKNDESNFFYEVLQNKTAVARWFPLLDY